MRLDFSWTHIGCFAFTHPCFVPVPLADLQQPRSALPGWAGNRGQAHSRPLPCSTLLLLSGANPVTHEVLEVVGESFSCSSLPRCQSWLLCRQKGPCWSKAAGLVQGKAAARDDGGAGNAHARGAGSGSHAAVRGDTRPEAQPSTRDQGANPNACRRHSLRGRSCSECPFATGLCPSGSYSMGGEKSPGTGRLLRGFSDRETFGCWEVE